MKNQPDVATLLANYSFYLNRLDWADAYSFDHTQRDKFYSQACNELKSLIAQSDKIKQFFEDELRRLS